ncbi:interstitial collagenase-like [Daphnia pulicaria]|uniref:interstitial collagenase-like n=1 Tax=Daphnia pulicaria TaxID=35523 RepID=UPI001EEAD61E|nr:interstitial collagenase-like [Daphnia pulicaria]
MLRLMSWTLSLMCCLLVINCGDAAPIDIVNEAMVQHKFDAETLKGTSETRCGVTDGVHLGFSTRQKRFVLEGNRWPNKQITYTIKQYTTDMSKDDVDREIAKAFQMWADVADLTFVHLNESSTVDIEILFVSAVFDGPGGVLGKSSYPREGAFVHFDESETWTQNSDKETSLFQVATHQFGHTLGLRHSSVRTAVMSPIYDYSPDFKLDKDDIEGIQALYGENPLSKSKTKE